MKFLSVILIVFCGLIVHAEEDKTADSTIKSENADAALPAEQSLPVATQAQSTAPPIEPTKSEESKERLWSLGPSVELGIPHLIGYGLTYVHSNRIFSVSYNFGGMDIQDGNGNIRISNKEIALRWHPFTGTFFLGILLGQQNLTVTSTDNISSQSISVTGSMDTNYTTPNIGWFSGVSDNGFFSSFELGYQLSSGTESTITSNASGAVTSQAEYMRMINDTKNSLNEIGNTSLPYFTLLKFGYLF